MTVNGPKARALSGRRMTSTRDSSDRWVFSGRRGSPLSCAGVTRLRQPRATLPWRYARVQVPLASSRRGNSAAASSGASRAKVRAASSANPSTEGQSAASVTVHAALRRARIARSWGLSRRPRWRACRSAASMSSGETCASAQSRSVRNTLVMGRGTDLDTVAFGHVGEMNEYALRNAVTYET